ncbi:MAG: protein kinase [Acidobacteria bacterium]|nr:protein kinase [Acidobacteriota bacterium]
MDHPLPEAIVRRYRVEGQIGSGGMGVVYKATDTRLNRSVAIKAIHDGRFRQGGDPLRTEALAAASIDHPYICKVYELIEEGTEAYLVMEFVEGETLAAILRRGRPPLTQAVQLASEIAEGLAAAHSRGLVHRDVKPSNVIVTTDGHVKLLDFGLAREDAVAKPSDQTRTSPSDRTDQAAGTPQYMSPEQAAGHPVTFRADLFSMGVVMFECLTGQLPFMGLSSYDYVRHLLTDAPRRLDRLAQGAPAGLVDLVERCLEKNPADRPESAAAVLAELRHISGGLTAAGGTFNTVGAEQSKRRWQWIAAAVAVGGLAVAAWQWSGRTPDADPLRRSRPVVMWSSEETASRLSADGKWLSFVSTRDGAPQLFVQPVAGTEARPVTLSAGRILSHAWSPGGDQLAVALGRRDNTVLQVVPAFFGGVASQSLVLNPGPNEVRVLRWIGRRIFLQLTSNSARSLSVADLDAGTVTDLSASWSLAGVVNNLDVHPDGRRVVVALRSGDQEDLWETDLAGASPRRLTNDAFYERMPIWSGTGEAVIFQTNRGGQSDLWERDSSGRLRPLTSSQTEETPEGTSADGSIVSFQQGSDEAKLWLIDPATRVGRQLASDALSDFAPAVSADGQTLVFQRSEPSPSQGYRILDSQLFVAGLGNNGLTAAARPVTAGFAGQLSPDGARLAFMQRGDKPGLTSLSVADLATEETSRVLGTTRLAILQQYPVEWGEQLMAWQPGSDVLYFVDHGTVQTIVKYRSTARKNEGPIFTAAANSFVRDLFVSIDGRQLAFLTRAAGRFGVWVRDLVSGQQREVASLTGSFTSVYGRGWLADRRMVIVRSVEVNQDSTSTMEVLLVGADGATTTAGTISNAILITARLDPTFGTLYLTRAEGGVHNVYGFSIASGRLTQVTDNALPGVSFSGVRRAGRSLIAVRNQRARDIWLIETQPETPAGGRN